jgi:signal transduction histidine kinase
MAATGWLRRNRVEVAWASFAFANLVAMALLPSWETVPFHFIWISLTIVYGFRVWEPGSTSLVLAIVVASTGAVILGDAFSGEQLWGELFEVPLMSAMFLAMVWHARRRQDATRTLEREVRQRAELLAQQKRFLHDVSHELRTPVTIARGHLEVLQRLDRPTGQEVAIALDELGRIESILERLLLLAKSKQPDFVTPAEIEIEPFLEDVFLRWSEVVPRSWALGPVTPGTLLADPEALRIALDALLENAVKHTDERDAITLRGHAVHDEFVIEVADEGPGIPEEAVDRVFDRFARADSARSRATGGVGLGLAIVEAITRAHGGGCAAANEGGGAVFTLRFPAFVSEATPGAGAVSAQAPAGTLAAPR